MNSSMTQGRTFAKGMERVENYVIKEKEHHHDRRTMTKYITTTRSHGAHVTCTPELMSARATEQGLLAVPLPSSSLSPGADLGQVRLRFSSYIALTVPSLEKPTAHICVALPQRHVHMIVVQGPDTGRWESFSLGLVPARMRAQIEA